MKIKVVTVNLWLGGILIDSIIEFLKAQNADLVLMQEVYNGEDPELEQQYRSMQVLQQALGYPYADFVADYRDFDQTDGKAQRGNGILSKFALTSHDPIYFDTPYSETYRDVPEQFPDCPRDLQHVTAATPDGMIEVFNIQGVWDLDGDRYSDKRQKMAQTVIQEVKDLPYVILAGDTNAKPTNQAIIDIEQHLKSVFEKDELQSTFNMRRKDNPGYATAAVDMILVSPSMRVVEKSCPDVDVSDHLPLVAVLDVELK